MGVALGFLFYIVVKQLFVHDVVARLGHDVVVVGGTVCVNRAGAGSAVYRIKDRYADERNVAALFQRKNVVVVLEQDDALALDLADFRFARRLQFGNAVVLTLEIARIALGFALCQRADDLGGRRAERRVNLTGTFSGDDVARKDDGAQSCRDVQKRFFQRSLR